MSGVLLMDSVPALTAPHPTKPRFLLSHGRHDPVVPFASGGRARDLLEKHGFSVTWRPFDGGHDIPAPVLADVDRFLFSAAVGNAGIFDPATVAHSLVAAHAERVPELARLYGLLERAVAASGADSDAARAAHRP